MADTVTTSENLNIGLEFDIDGNKKTATIKIPNHGDGLTEEQIKAAFNNSVLLYNFEGNTMNVTSDNVLTASTVNETINNLDIGWED